MRKSPLKYGPASALLPVYRIQVLDRTLQLLDILAESNRELGTAELTTRLSLNKSTVHRLLMVLKRHQLVRKNPVQAKYGLGMKLFELGTRAVNGIELRARAEPFLKRLVDETDETAHLCILDQTEMVSIANLPGPWTLQIPSTIGRRAPLHCTAVGKAFIAFLPNRVLTGLLSQLTLKRFTAHTIVTRTALKTELSRVRERGYAIDDEEIEQGLRCVGAPIRDHTGRVVASVSIAGPIYRVTKARLPALVRTTVTIARDFSRSIGDTNSKSARHA
jgi:DNA-binding IclR family transcriptional regulator